LETANKHQAVEAEKGCVFNKIDRDMSVTDVAECKDIGSDSGAKNDQIDDTSTAVIVSLRSSLNLSNKIRQFTPVYGRRTPNNVGQWIAFSVKYLLTAMKPYTDETIPSTVLACFTDKLFTDPNTPSKRVPIINCSILRARINDQRNLTWNELDDLIQDYCEEVDRDMSKFLSDGDPPSNGEDRDHDDEPTHHDSDEEKDPPDNSRPILATNNNIHQLNSLKGADSSEAVLNVHNKRQNSTATDADLESSTMSTLTQMYNTSGGIRPFRTVYKHGMNHDTWTRYSGFYLAAIMNPYTHRAIPTTVFDFLTTANTSNNQTPVILDTTLCTKLRSKPNLTWLQFDTLVTDYCSEMDRIYKERNYTAGSSSLRVIDNTEIKCNDKIIDENLNALVTEEVECKFRLTTEFEKYMRQFPSVVKEFTDIYYDDIVTYTLASMDFWLRCRDGKFELKRPSSAPHDGGISSYTEITANALILKELGISWNAGELDDTTGSIALILKQNNIEPYAEISTHRTSYQGLTKEVSKPFRSNLYDPKSLYPKHTFQIDIDQAGLRCLLSDDCSTYNICEVEMKNPLVMDAKIAIRDVMSQLQLPEEAILSRLNGKLIECIQRHNPACCSVLVHTDIKNESEEGTATQLDTPTPDPFLTTDVNTPSEGLNTHEDIVEEFHMMNEVFEQDENTPPELLSSIMNPEYAPEDTQSVHGFCNLTPPPIRGQVNYLLRLIYRGLIHKNNSTSGEPYTFTSFQLTTATPTNNLFWMRQAVKWGPIFCTFNPYIPEPYVNMFTRGVVFTTDYTEGVNLEYFISDMDLRRHIRTHLRATQGLSWSDLDRLITNYCLVLDSEITARKKAKAINTDSFNQRNHRMNLHYE